MQQIAMKFVQWDVPELEKVEVELKSKKHESND